MLNQFLFLATFAILSIAGVNAEEQSELPIIPATTTETIQETADLPADQAIDLAANDDRSEGSDEQGCGCDGACGCNKNSKATV